MNLIFVTEHESVKKELFDQWVRYVTAILTFSDHLGRETEFDPSSMHTVDSILMLGIMHAIAILQCFVQVHTLVRVLLLIF